MWLILAISVCLGELVLTLRLTKFHIPEFATYGERVVLKCNFELDQDDGELHSVKWYKYEGKEMTNFYTYKPKGTAKRYNIPGVRVLMKESSHKQVTLKKVKIISSGLYKCEVTTRKPEKRSKYGRSGSGPQWNAVDQDGRMQVIELPDSPPEITGGATNYAYGDQVDLNCTSKPSYPPTRLTWYISNTRAREDLVNGEVMLRSADMLYTTISQLTIKIHRSLFKYGEIRIKCIARLTEEPIQGDSLPEGDVFSLDAINLPEAMKLQTENFFDVPVTSGGRVNFDQPNLCFILIATAISAAQRLSSN